MKNRSTEKSLSQEWAGLEFGPIWAVLGSPGSTLKLVSCRDGVGLARGQGRPILLL